LGFLIVFFKKVEKIVILEVAHILFKRYNRRAREKSTFYFFPLALPLRTKYCIESFITNERKNHGPLYNNISHGIGHRRNYFSVDYPFCCDSSTLDIKKSIPETCNMDIDVHIPAIAMPINKKIQ
jgi:hypothetical protein